MTIKDMHYDFKMKLNKIDSQQYNNLVIPEIDWILNDAVRLFIKLVAEPRSKSLLGFERNQRTIDDIRTLVVTPKSNPNANITINDNLAELPDDYLHYVNGYVICSKKCDDKTVERKCRLHIQQHDDEFEDNPFYKSDFEWKWINGTFSDNHIELYTNNFSANKLLLTYIKQPLYIHNAEDFRNGQYKINGILYTGHQDCELPEDTHSEIVDLAVYIASELLQTPSYQAKLQKLQLNKLI